MTQEEKSLLLKDLCARLPYGVKVQVNEWTSLDTVLKVGHIARLINGDIELKPYLRSMSSMTKEEKKEYESLRILIPVNYDSYLSKYDYYTADSIDSFDWLNAHHLDYRGLIEKGLALEAPEEMYKIN